MIACGFVYVWNLIGLITQHTKDLALPADPQGLALGKRAGTEGSE
jgi:hypothetical protein